MMGAKKKKVERNEGDDVRKGDDVWTKSMNV